MSNAATGLTPVIEGSASGDPTIAISFGGGGARGYAHIHVIEVMDELGIRPVAISGASIGAIMGSAMASGMRGEDIRDYTLDIMSNRGALLSKFWGARPSGLADMMNGGMRLGQFNIERILKSFLPEEIPDTFEALNIPLAIVATDFYGHKETYFEYGELRSAIAASAALPGIFKPIKRDDVFYIDGGIYNPIPYEHLVGKADIIIGVDVIGAPEGDRSKAPKAIDSLYGTSQLMMQSLIQMKLQLSAPDIFVTPPVSEFRVMDFLKAKRILEATASVRDDLKYRLDGAITAFEADRCAGG
ncbi:MAG: patatin-like phospholipase family protein [Pseudomonadota bacterium]